jgi:hypothetical protein
MVPPVPTGTTFAQLNGVTCVSATNCTAVGFAGSGTAQKMLILHWNGTNWMVVPPPVLSAATGSDLFSLWCSNANSCDAVGNFFVGSSSKPLAIHWTGTHWKQVGMPTPTGALYPTPQSISCAGATNCWAVGLYTAGGKQRGLVERWNGTSWKLGSAPAPTGATGTMFNAVRCVTATNCWLVGAYDIFARQWNLVEHWNGTKWSVVNSPWVTGANSTLYGIACGSATNCTAVGSYTHLTMQGTLIEHWTGAKWLLVKSPSVTGFSSNVLSGVACPSLLKCKAVGTAFESTTPGTQSTALIESN